MEVSVNAFDKICRACLTRTKNMKSLFTKLEDNHLLLDLFVFSLNIEVNSTDGLPKQVCSDCEAFIQKAGEFRKRCMESDTILQNVYHSHLGNSATETEKEIKTDCVDKSNYTVEELEKRDLINLLSNQHLQKLVECDQKDTVKTEIGDYENDYSNDFDDNEILVEPIELKQENNVEKTLKMHTCLCDQEFDSDALKIHSRFCAKKIEKTQIAKKFRAQCQKCNFIFDSVNEWCKHQQNFHSSTIQDTHTFQTEDIHNFHCSLCSRKFKTKKSLSRHIKKHETNDSIRHVCTKCKREFKYRSFLDSHMTTHKDESTFACDDYTESFQSLKNLEMHREIHRKRKNICPFCNKSFLLLCTLKDHLRTHTGEKPFLCSTCGKGFSQKTNLAQHMRRHMGVKPFKCDTCSMGFVSKGELDAHTRKHSGAHPFICDECGNGFTTSSALVKHRRTHTGERPYACDLCPMKFAATGTLKNHRRTHTGERPFQCSHCEKAFVQRSDLISHIRCHTGERPFVCPQCGQAFRKAAAMKAHVKMHSRETHNGITMQGGLMLNGMQ